MPDFNHFIIHFFIVCFGFVTQFMYKLTSAPLVLKLLEYNTISFIITAQKDPTFCSCESDIDVYFFVCLPMDFESFERKFTTRTLSQDCFCSSYGQLGIVSYGIKCIILIVYGSAIL